MKEFTLVSTIGQGTLAWERLLGEVLVLTLQKLVYVEADVRQAEDFAEQGSLGEFVRLPWTGHLLFRTK